MSTGRNGIRPFRLRFEKLSSSTTPPGWTKRSRRSEARRLARRFGRRRAAVIRHRLGRGFGTDDLAVRGSAAALSAAPDGSRPALSGSARRDAPIGPPRSTGRQKRRSGSPRRSAREAPERRPAEASRPLARGISGEDQRFCRRLPTSLPRRETIGSRYELRERSVPAPGGRRNLPGSGGRGPRRSRPLTSGRQRQAPFEMPPGLPDGQSPPRTASRERWHRGRRSEPVLAAFDESRGEGLRAYPEGRRRRGKVADDPLPRDDTDRC